ncbi:phosphoketolase [Streptomyces sp. TRM66268-LWL]|uniref:Phosphoketolase n=1 Tax=Streptomyces polyasparticus TaxID=2767826 RepID=A0ABR7SUX7_9ACTN|nr:phosphoketolase [Streptomyces polyasparticus]MBC9718450.1 phosphoketolase [Streptomyces polyasparticus]
MTMTARTLLAAADWPSAAAEALEAIPDAAVDAYWRALNYLSAAQLYLADNVRLEQPLHPDDLKAVPRGHWGVCPPVNFALAHLGPLIALSPPGSDVVIVHGAGHAGPSALAAAYLNNTLDLGSGTGWSMPNLRTLISQFPNTDLGGEITPLIPGIRYTGGQLGPALAVAQGMAFDAPHRLVVPLIGDGEMETPITAAAWTGRRALIGTGPHGAVLPIVLANGLKMGGASLLAGLDEKALCGYFTGLGYRPFVHDGRDEPGFRRMLAQVLSDLTPLDANAPQPVIVLTMPKGHTGPTCVGDRQIAGTPAVHKTPLTCPKDDDAEFAALTAWLTSYRPRELFTAQGHPTILVRQALPGSQPPAPALVGPRRWDRTGEDTGWRAVSAVIRQRAQDGGFRLFSPDELTSNKIDTGGEGTGTPPWTVEVLSEELCHGWLQGYTESGRDALLATYEAFAPINTSLLVQHLKHRRLAAAAGRRGQPSLNYLITSLGWRNTYTHQNPGLAAAMAETEEPSLHVYTPADAHRAAVVLDAMLASTDQLNLLISDKHHRHTFPTGPFSRELALGAAVWPHLTTCGSADPDLVLASAGDVAARELTAAARHITTGHPEVTIRYVHINDLTTLGPPTTWPHALSETDFADLFGRGLPVLIVTSTTPGIIRSLLAARGDADRFHITGYRDPGRPLHHAALLDHCSMSAPQLAARALALHKERRS